MQFTSRSNAWAVGEAFPPPDAQGSGEFVVLRTTDAGHTWTEIPKTMQYSLRPAFRFLGPQKGWLSYTEFSAPRMGEVTVLRTTNGGQTWSDLSRDFPTFPSIVDAKHWFYFNHGKFVRTADAGRTWQTTVIHGLDEIELGYFRSPSVGWLVSFQGNTMTVFRTADGGLRWDESKTAVPDGPTGVENIFFNDDKRGWLITWHGQEGSYVFATEDGGRTWAREAGDIPQGEHVFINTIVFLPTRLGLVFADQNLAGQNEPSHVMAYTTDGGKRWLKEMIPLHVSDCQVYHGDVLCSASGDKSRQVVLRLHPN